MTGSGRTVDLSPYGQVFAVGNGSSLLSDKPWGIWGKGYGLFGDRESEAGVNGYRYTTYGFGLGADYQVTGKLLAGVTIGFSDSRADYFSSRDESSADALHLGIYTRFTSNPWYVDGLVTYSGLDYQTDRYVDLTSEHLVGQFSGSDLGGYLEAGLKWRNWAGWQVNPLAGLQLSFLDVDGYTETGGASALTYASQSYESIRGSLGARAVKDLSDRVGGVRAVWEVRGRWVHELGDNQSTVNAAFVSDPAVIFKVSDAEMSRDSALLGTGFNARLNDHARVSLDYDVRLNADETIHVIGLVGEYRW